MELGSEGGEGEDLEERKRDLIKMHHYVYVELSSNKELISLLRRPEICNPRTVGMAVFADAGGKWGYLNTDGTVVIEPVYDYAAVFTSGSLALVQKDGLCGAVRPDGSTAVEIKYENIGMFMPYMEN